MVLNVSEYDNRYDFELVGASYIGNPKPNTIMFITRKIGHILSEIHELHNCLIFVEKGLEIPSYLMEDNCFILTPNPELEYQKIMLRFEEAEFSINRHRKYVLHQDGYYMGENVKLGKDPYIEPGVVIGHDVVIGDHARIYAGAKIFNSIIGNNFIANENAVIGSNGYALVKDQDGLWQRVPTLGKLIIGNNVEIGALSNISVGLGGDTCLEDNVKTDALVYIGHNARLGKNNELSAASIVAGFVQADDNIFTGINSSVRNRVSIGKNAIIGMGAVVTKSVPENTTVIGNPAKNKY